MPRCYIFDLDGTIADLSHRLHHIITPGQPKNWDAFFAHEEVLKDALIPHVANIIHFIKNSPFHHFVEVVIVSGRSDVCRAATEEWLEMHDIQYDALYMRKAGDRRPDYQVKYDLLQQLKAADFLPLMAFDDRDQVVKMWRDNGIPCAQVAPGDF